jgi:DNA primase
VGIADDDIAKVREATDLVALVSERIGLRRVGTRYTGLCPFHAEKSPSFSVSAERGFYYCFGCHASGDAISFVRELDGLDFVEAVEYLAGRVGIALRRDDGTGGRDLKRRNRVYDAVAQAVTWYHEQLNARTNDAGRARGYLRHERGYDRDIVQHYQLGWAPDGWEHLARALRLPREVLVDAGLVRVGDDGRHRDFFRSRLMFPIFEPGGRAIGAGGRILPGGRPPKYMNTNNTVVYDKHRALYGLNWAKKAAVDHDRIVVCEGYTDVIGMGVAGVTEAVATCGTALTEGHVRQLTHFSRRLVLAFDADDAGQGAAEKYYDWEQRHEVDIRIARLPEGADPGDLSRSDPAALRRAVDEARPFLAFRLDRLFDRADLRTAEGRARAATAAVGLVDTHPSDLVRDQYLMEIADRCRIPADRLRQLGQPPARVATGTGPRPILERPAGPSGAETPLPAVGGAELQALLLAVHRPEEVAERLEPCLFDHALAAGAFAALLEAPTLHEAIDGAAPQVATLLRRLAVEGCEEETDDIMIRLVERAGDRAYRELLADMRQSPDPAAYSDLLGWVKLTMETLRSPEHGREAEDLLVAWLVDRSRPGDTEAGSDSSGGGAVDLACDDARHPVIGAVGVLSGGPE